jgi:hypothetical protein
MRQARELKIALRAEIMDVLSRDNESAAGTSDGSCPYGGKARPSRVGSDGSTLHL